MIGYVTLGTNDLDRAGEFYDALLSQIGAECLMDFETFKAWGVSADATRLSVVKPADGNAATVWNGVMVALAVDTPEKVNLLQKTALELGGTDEGAPGPRDYVPGSYAAYFRDLDGKKLNAFCRVPSD